MFHLRIAAGVLIAVSVLINSETTECQPQPKRLLATLTTLITSPLSEESTHRQLELTCATYERTIRTFLPADQKATASKNELYAFSLSQANSEPFLNTEEKRVVNDIRHCIAFNSNPMPFTASTSAPASTPPPESDYDKGIHNDKQQARAKLPMFDKRGLFNLSKLNYESREETRTERCRLFDETLRHIYNRTRPELVSASTMDVFEVAIEELESRNPPALIALEECAIDLQHEKMASSTGNGIQQQRVDSEPAQLEQTQKSSEQQASDSELSRQLESDLEREKGLISERVQETDGSHRQLCKEASLGALRKLELEIENFKHDWAQLMSKVATFHEISILPVVTDQMKSESIRTINIRVNRFHQELKRQLKTVLDNLELLKAEQNQVSQQYESIREALSKLVSKFKFGQFKEDLAQGISNSERQAGYEEVKSINGGLGEFLAVLNVKLDMVSSLINAIECEQVQGSQAHESESMQDQGHPQPPLLDIYSKLANLEQTQEQLMKQHASDRELLKQMGSNFADVVRRLKTQQNQEQPQSEQFNYHSKLAQLEHGQEELMKKQASGNEVLKRLQSDVLREKRLALEREHEIDEFQRRVSKEASLGALSTLKSESDDLKDDLTLFVDELDDILDGYAHTDDREREQSVNANLIIKRVERFHQELKRQLKTALDNIEVLKAKQNQDSQQYGPIGKALSKIESEFQFEQFKRNLAKRVKKVESESGLKRVMSIKQRLDKFLEVLNEKLETAMSEIGK